MSGAKSSVTVDCEQQKRERESNSFGKPAELLLFVTAGWSAAPQHSLTPTPAWPLPGSQVELRDTWRPGEEEGL